MKRAIIIAGALAAATPALAAEFYVVRGPDKKCVVVEKRPVDTKMVVIGDRAFVTREEAEKQLKVICK
jgi:hypothetical protein